MLEDSNQASEHTIVMAGADLVSASTTWKVDLNRHAIDFTAVKPEAEAPLVNATKN